MSKISTVLCVAFLGHLVAGSAIAAAGNLLSGNNGDYCVYNSFLSPQAGDSFDLHWGVDVGTQTGGLPMSFPFATGSMYVHSMEEVYLTRESTALGASSYVIVKDLYVNPVYQVGRVYNGNMLLGNEIGTMPTSGLHLEVYNGVAASGSVPVPSPTNASGFKNPEILSEYKGFAHTLYLGSDPVIMSPIGWTYTKINDSTLEALICSKSDQCGSSCGVYKLELELKRTATSQTSTAVRSMDTGAEAVLSGTITLQAIYGDPVVSNGLYVNRVKLIDPNAFATVPSADPTAYIRENFEETCKISRADGLWNVQHWTGSGAEEKPPVRSAAVDVVPNPANPGFRVDLVGFEPDVKVSLYDISGRRLDISVPVFAASEGLYAVPEIDDLRSLPTGTYLVGVSDSVRSISRKVLLLK